MGSHREMFVATYIPLIIHLPMLMLNSRSRTAITKTARGLYFCPFQYKSRSTFFVLPLYWQKRLSLRWKRHVPKIFQVLALLFFLFRDVEMERTAIGLQHKIYIHHYLADQSFFQHQNTEPIPSSVMVGSFANSGELIIVPNALDNHVLAVNVCSKFSHYCKESCQPTGRTGRSLYSSDFIFEQLITSLSRQLLLLVQLLNYFIFKTSSSRTSRSWPWVHSKEVSAKYPLLSSY